MANWFGPAAFYSYRELCAEYRLSPSLRAELPHILHALSRPIQEAVLYTLDGSWLRKTTLQSCADVDVVALYDYGKVNPDNFSRVVGTR